MKYVYSYIWAVIWGIITLILLLLPSNDLPDMEKFNFFQGVDKIVHLGIFFVLTILLYWESARKYQWQKNKWLTIAKVVISTVLFAGFTEIAQMFVSTRSSDIFDLYADCLGIGMATFSFLLFHPKAVMK